MKPRPLILARPFCPHCGHYSGLCAATCGATTACAAVGTQRKDILEKARLEAEALTRDARLAANEEALKSRAEIEQSWPPPARRNLPSPNNASSPAKNWSTANWRTWSRRKKCCAPIATRCGQNGRSRSPAQIGRAIGRPAPRRIGRRLQNERERSAERLFQANRTGKHARRHAAFPAHPRGRQSRAEEQARKIISLAIQRYAGHHSFETSTATVNIKARR
jgi:hypothetical protein